MIHPTKIHDGKGIMKAMIFAAGLGSRLRPLTDNLPKALVPIGGKPLLQHVIEKLKEAGVTEIIINLHHFAEQIIDFVERRDRFGIRIEFSDERDQLLNTGGAIKKAAWFFDDGRPFLVHNVDILSNIDLGGLLNHHHESRAQATLVCSARATSRYLLFDERGRLTGWMNEKSGEVKSPFPDFDPSSYQKLAFSGIHMIDPALIDCMKDWPRAFSIIDFYLDLCQKAPILSATPPGYRMIDVGKPEAIAEATRFLSQ